MYYYSILCCLSAPGSPVYPQRVVLLQTGRGSCCLSPAGPVAFGCSPPFPCRPATFMAVPQIFKRNLKYYTFVLSFLSPNSFIFASSSSYGTGQVNFSCWDTHKAALATAQILQTICLQYILNTANTKLNFSPQSYEVLKPSRSRQAQGRATYGVGCYHGQVRCWVSRSKHPSSEPH